MSTIAINDCEGNVLYSLEECEMFPNYTAVLKDAIAQGKDLTGLCIKNQNISNVVFQGTTLYNAVFENCNFHKVEFIECQADSVWFNRCNLDGLKVKKTNLSKAHIQKCSISKAHFTRSNLNDSLIFDSNLHLAVFLKTQLNNVSFYNCNLEKAEFEECSLADAGFYNLSPTYQWINDVLFSNCILNDCDLSSLKSLSMLFIRESNIEDAELQDQNFTRVINTYTKVLYAIESDTVWWEDFRGNFEQFKDMVENDTMENGTKYYLDDFLYDELSKVVCYLEQWHNDRVLFSKYAKHE